MYESTEEQESYDKPLSDAIGWNCIQRRNFGLLWAFDMKADIVAVIDDDNIPLKSWGKDLYVNQEVRVKQYQTSQQPKLYNLPYDINLFQLKMWIKILQN